jgi:hypothetical protein
MYCRDKTRNEVKQKMKHYSGCITVESSDELYTYFLSHQAESKRIFYDIMKSHLDKKYGNNYVVKYCCIYGDDE